MPPLTRGAAGPNHAGLAAAVSAACAALKAADGARAAEVGVRVVDAGVDDRDLDALAAIARGSATRWALRSAGRRSCWSGRITCSGRTAITPGSVASWAALSRAIRTLMPLYDDWYVATTVPPSAWMLLVSAFCGPLRAAFAASFSAFDSFLPAASCCTATGSPGELEHDIHRLLAEADGRRRRSEQHRAIGHGLWTHGTGVRRRQRTEHHCHRGKRASRFESHEFSLH